MEHDFNINTCKAEKGRHHRNTIFIKDYKVIFGASTSRSLGLNAGDKVSFRLKDGVLKMFFDNKCGFEIARKKNNNTSYMYVIHNNNLSKALKKIIGIKAEVGDFADGGYILTKY